MVRAICQSRTTKVIAKQITASEIKPFKPKVPNELTGSSDDPKFKVVAVKELIIKTTDMYTQWVGHHPIFVQ